MCRSKQQGGRRCPYHSDPRVMAAASARQAAARMEERVTRAEAAGIPDEKLSRRVEKLVNAHERLNQREQAVTAAGWGEHRTGAEGRQAVGPAKPTRADEITAERVNAMPWDQVSDLASELGDDPEAWDKLETLVNEREAREAEEKAQAEQQEFNAWLSGGSTGGDDPVTNPAARPSRRLSRREQAREEYESYVASQYFRAEEEIGFLLNAEGRAKGVDAYSLFSGPVSRAKKYGSEELQSWFARNGRHTLSSYRHSVMGWDSDRKAAENARIEDFANVAHV